MSADGHLKNFDTYSTRPPPEPGDSRTAPESPHDRQGRGRGLAVAAETVPDQQKALPGGRARTRAPGRTRTCGQALRRRLLYPLSYGGLVRVKDKAPRSLTPSPRLRGSMWRFGEAVKIIAGGYESCIAFAP